MSLECTQKVIDLQNNYLGEFGVVYRGQLTGWAKGNSTELVAVKTLKGINSLTGYVIML